MPQGGGPGRPREKDFYGWTMGRAAALRRAAPPGLNTPEVADWENLAEEIEDSGREQADEFESAYRVLLRHLLGWRHQPERRSGRWRVSIVEQPKRAAWLLRRNPGLKPRRGSRSPAPARTRATSRRLGRGWRRGSFRKLARGR